jgi:hypothetical protein
MFESDRGSNRRLEKITQKELHDLYLLFIRYYYGDEIKEDEISGACSTHGRVVNEYKLLV